MLVCLYSINMYVFICTMAYHKLIKPHKNLIKHGNIVKAQAIGLCHGPIKIVMDVDFLMDLQIREVNGLLSKYDSLLFKIPQILITSQNQHEPIEKIKERRRWRWRISKVISNNS